MLNNKMFSADYSLKNEHAKQQEVQADYSLQKMNRVKQKLGELEVKKKIIES